MSLSFGEVLSEFKSNQPVDTIAPLTEDSELRNALVAWKSVEICYTDSEPCPDSMSDVQKWNWMWSKVQFDMSMFATVSGCKKHEASDLFQRLKGLRLIYPDGSVNSNAEQFIQALVVSKLPGNRGRGRPKKGE